MTKEEMISRLEQIEKDIWVCSLDSTFEEDTKSCAIRQAIEELKSKWIPCSERLPKPYTEVLASDGSMVDMAIYSDKYDIWQDVGSMDKWKDVLAWMPLPEPYKGGEE